MISGSTAERVPGEVGVDVGAVPVEEAADDGLLLGGERASGPDGHGVEASPNRLEVGGVGLGATQLREELSEREAVLFAGHALATRFDCEEPRRPCRDGGEVVGVVVDDEPGGSEAAANRGESFVADRHMELVFGDEHVGHSG